MEQHYNQDRKYVEAKFSVANADILIFYSRNLWNDTPFKNRNNPRHSHAWYEFYYIRNGEVTVETDTNTYSLKSGDSLLIPPGVFHSSNTAVDYTDFINVGFEIKKNKIETSENVYGQFSEVFSIEDCRFISYEPYTTYYMNQLRGYANAGIDLNCQRVNSLMTCFLFSLSDRIAGEKTYLKYFEPLKTRGSVYAILDCMQLEDAIHVSLQEFSKQNFMTTKQVNHLCKERYNMTYKQRQIRIRIENAKKLLIETDININEIASMVGYTNFTSFYKTFKELVGKSPAQYRKTLNVMI